MKRLNKKVVGLILGLLITVSPGIAAQKKFTIGVENFKYLPLHEVDGEDYIGFSRELLDLFAETNGYQFIYKVRPVKKLFSEFLESQSIDFKYPDNPSWEVKAKKKVNLTYSTPVGSFIEGIMTLPQNRLKGLNKLKKLGTIAGFTIPLPEVEDLINHGKIQRLDSETVTRLIYKTLQGEVDGLYANVDVISYQLEEIYRKPNALIFDNSLPYMKGFYQLSTIKHAEVIKKFNDFLEKEKRAIRMLKYRYGVDVYDSKLIYTK